MSRIHEALKKAELERISTSRDVAASGSELQHGADIRTENVARMAVSTLAESKVSGADPQPIFRFEDVQTRCVQRWQPDQQANVFNTASSARAAEQFRTLRSRLYQVRACQQLKILLITSAVPGEGKTFLATNLGYAIARQPDRRILLIDADLRRSQMHVLLGARSSPGLADYLRDGMGEMSVIQHSPENNLSFIAGGSNVPNPSELLSNGRLATLLRRLEPIFEWIIVDSPPCLPVADAILLAEYCDASVIVARAGMTPAPVVQKGVQEMQGKKVVGVVLNAVEETTPSYDYYNSDYGGATSRH